MFFWIILQLTEQLYASDMCSYLGNPILNAANEHDFEKEKNRLDHKLGAILLKFGTMSEWLIRMGKQLERMI